MSKFSVKRPYLVLVVVLALVVLGVTGFSRMTTDFLPELEFPYIIAITTYPGATPQRVETEVTDVLEGGLSTINGVKNVTSTSSENYSQIFMEFEDDTNMDSAMVKVTSAINQLSLPESCGEPILMEISADMLATLYTSVGYKDLKGSELADFVNKNVLPRLKRQDGVASVEASGMVEESVEIRLSKRKIKDVNKDIATMTDEKLKKAGKEISSARSKLDSAESALNKQQKQLESTQDTTTSELAKYTQLMNQALANKAAYDSQVVALQTYQSALKSELDIYTGKGGVKESYDAANKAFSDARKNLQLVIDNPAATEEQKQQATATRDSLPKDVKDAIDNPEKLEAFKALSPQAAALDADSLKQMYDIVNTRIPQINSELANIKTELAAAKALQKQVTKQIKKATDNYNNVEKQKMSATAAFGAGNAGISQGQQSVEDGKKELDEAQESYENSRDAALENANINQLLTMSTLSQLLSAQNFSMPIGYINDDKTQYLLKIDEEEADIDSIKKIPLTYIKGIGNITVDDVADVTIIDNSDDMYAKINGQETVVLSVFKASTAGTSEVSDNIADACEELKKEYEGLSFTPIMDQGDYIRIIISSVMSNLVWGAILAIIVLLLFLQDLRPTIVVAFSIPLSVLFAILLMYFSKMSLNIISLSGLALGIGMLVDNSIVVMENIYRYRSEGLNAPQAAIKGANQVASAIFASTLTTVCVFLPIVFTDGLSRQLLQDMCLTITFSLMASLIVALTVVPTLGSTLLRNDSGREHRLFERVMDGYEALLAFSLKVKIVPIALAVGLLVFCASRIASTGIVMIPEMSSYQMQVGLTMNPDTDKKEDYALCDEVSDRIRGIEGVETVGTLLSSTIGIGATDNKSFAVMILLDHDYATQNHKIAKKIDTILADYDLADYSVSETNMDTSSVLGSGLSVNIIGENEEKLLAISRDVMDIIKVMDGFEEISNGQEDADTELVLNIDKEKAIKKNLTVAQIFQAINDKLSSEKDATKITVDEKNYNVIIVDERDELNKDNLMKYEIETTRTGDDGTEKKVSYPLSDFARIEKNEALASIAHDNSVKEMTVTAAVDDEHNATLLSRDLEERLKNYDVPEGYRVEIGGESESVNEMVKNMLLMLLVAVILIYLIMVAQFQNFLSPFIVMFTIPLAFTGGFIALMATGQELSLLSMMGFLILSGVVVNNGIVFIDYANQLRRLGMDKRRALIVTGRTRMRPILMTAMTTILAMSVMAFSNGEAAEMGRGMAIVTIGGLTYATLMTLFIVPVLYDLFYRKDIFDVDLGDEEDLK